jgi:predicted nucleotidyltransferase
LSRGFDIYIREAKRLEKIYRNPYDLLRRIKGDLRRIIPDAEVYLFGSIARGKYTMASDIDVLVIVDSTSKLNVDRVKAFIKRKYIEYPIELHIVSRREFEKWYKRFIDEEELVRI